MEQNQESFYEYLFRSFHRDHRLPQIKPQSTGEALGMLKEHTGMSWEELGRSIGVLPSTVMLMVRRSSRIPVPVCEACKRMAGKFDLPVLEEYFDTLLRYLLRTKRRTKSDVRSEERKYYDEIR